MPPKQPRIATTSGIGGRARLARRAASAAAALLAAAMLAIIMGLAVPQTSTAAVRSFLGPGEMLTTNQYIDAPNGQYRLWMSPNGNLVLYAGARVLWSTQTHGNPGARAVQQVQGNLVVYSPSNVALWTNRMWDYPGATLHIQPDGNVVLYHYNRAIWATDTSQPPTWMPQSPPPTAEAPLPPIDDGGMQDDLPAPAQEEAPATTSAFLLGPVVCVVAKCVQRAVGFVVGAGGKILSRGSNTIKTTTKREAARRRVPFSKVEDAMKRANGAVQRVTRSSAWRQRRWYAVAVLLWKEMGPPSSVRDCVKLAALQLVSGSDLKAAIVACIGALSVSRG